MTHKSKIKLTPREQRVVTLLNKYHAGLSAYMLGEPADVLESMENRGIIYRGNGVWHITNPN